MIFKNRKALIGILFIVSSILPLSSCSTVAITGRQRLNLVSDSSINSMARDQYSEFMSNNKLSTDQEASAMVRRVGGRIKSAVEKYCMENNLSHEIAGYNWEFNLVQGEEVNAWAMPGGKVVVFEGIIPVAKDENGLAVVIGHEIAHVVAKHGSERLTQAMLVELGGMALSEAVASEPAKTQQIFMRSYSIGSNIGLVLPYSRLHEKEADHLGLIFMAKAGYDPREAVGFWERMSEQSGPNPPEFLSTHPSDKARIQEIENLLPEAMQYYNPVN